MRKQKLRAQKFIFLSQDFFDNETILFFAKMKREISHNLGSAHLLALNDRVANYFN